MSHTNEQRMTMSTRIEASTRELCYALGWSPTNQDHQVVASVLATADAHDAQNAIRRISVSLGSLSTVLRNTTLSARELWDIIEAITVREAA